MGKAFSELRRVQTKAKYTPHRKATRLEILQSGQVVDSYTVALTPSECVTTRARYAAHGFTCRMVR